MSIEVTYNGNTYEVPEYNDPGWAQNLGNMTQYLVALASGLSGWNGDIVILPPGAGVIMTDAVDGHTYRLLMYNGVISRQLVS